MNVPNRITILRIFLVAVFLIIYYIGFEGWSLFCAIVFFIAALTDIFDGAYARRNNQVTDLGKFLDPVADKLIVTAAIIVLLDIALIPSLFVIVIIAREFIVSALRMVAAASGSVIAAGLLGKLKTIFQMTAITLYFLSYAIFPEAIYYIHFIMYIAVFLTVWSGVDYVYRNRAVFKL